MTPDISQRDIQLTDNEQLLLDWLAKADGQYGECSGPSLDHLIKQGLAEVMGPEYDGGFIAKGDGIDYRAVRLTEAGRRLAQ